MNEHGHYGNKTFVGADASTSKSSALWWQIGIGAVVVGGVYYFMVRPAAREMKDLERATNARAREVGLKPGMSQTEQDRAWDAFYTKKGLKLQVGELVRVHGGQRY